MGDWIEIAGSRAYRSAPDSSSKGPVLLLHSWWGLNDTITALADRLAGDGFDVLAPDLFDGVVLDTIEAADAHVREVEADYREIYAKTQRAFGSLLEGDSSSEAAVIGFSFGAAYGHWLASHRTDLAGVVTFYGGLGFDVADGAEAEPWQWLISDTSPPYLGHFADEDQYEDEDPAGVAAFNSRLHSSNPLSAAYLYPVTKHWFFEADRPEFDSDAAELAYERTVRFLTDALRPNGG